MTDTFDEAAAGYGDLVQDSIAFAGQEHDFFIRRKADALRSLVARRLGPLEHLTALDVGCGVGSMAAHLVGDFGRLLGVEPSADSLGFARTRVPSMAMARGDGAALPFPDGVADVTFTVNVLHHVEPPDRNAVVDELRRVTRPGGIVVAFEHNPLNPLTRLSVHRCEFDDGVELLWPRELRRRFEEARLTTVERRYILFTPLDVAWQHRVEDRLGRFPLGAQYYVAGRR